MDRQAWFQPSGIRFHSFPVGGQESWTFLELRDEHGTAGLADISGASERSVVPLAAKLASRLRGERLFAAADALKLMQGEHSAGANPEHAIALSGVCTAVTCALAAAAGVPLAERLCGQDAGKAAPIKPVAVAPAAEGMRAHGDPAQFGAVVLEAPAAMLQPEGMDALLEQIRGISGAPVFVRCLGDLKLGTALEAVKALADAGAQRLEEPLNPATRSEDLRVLSENSPLPIGAGNRLHGYSRFKECLWQRSVDVITPDIRYCGGAEEAFRIVAELSDADGENAPFRLTGQSSPLSLAISGGVLAAAGRAEPLEAPAPGLAEWAAGLLAESPAGAGVELDPDAAARHGRQWEL